jgi:hypothetical protein
LELNRVAFIEIFYLIARRHAAPVKENLFGVMNPKPFGLIIFLMVPVIRFLLEQSQLGIAFSTRCIDNQITAILAYSLKFAEIKQP